MTTRPAATGLQAIRQRLDATVEEPTARESYRRHCENLEQLAAHLRQIGLDDGDIDTHVMGIFRQYERELVRYLDAVNDRHGET
ncbi:MAG: hypothetical protein AB7P02_04095 [Alphaproteobacteria bacterium]